MLLEIKKNNIETKVNGLTILYIHHKQGNQDSRSLPFHKWMKCP